MKLAILGGGGVRIPMFIRGVLSRPGASFGEIEVGSLQARVFERLARGGECERDGARDMLTVFRVELRLPVGLRIPAAVHGWLSHQDAATA